MAQQEQQQISQQQIFNEYLKGQIGEFAEKAAIAVAQNMSLSLENDQLREQNAQLVNELADIRNIAAAPAESEAPANPETVVDDVAAATGEEKSRGQRRSSSASV